MADLLNEQEQVDAIKHWWKRYGNWLMTIVIIILVILLAYRLWHNHEQKVMAVTSTSYEQLMVAVQQNKIPDAQAQANLLMQEYPHSIYASLAALTLAQIQLEQNQADQADVSLKWVMANSKDAATIMIAKIRLGRILIAQGQAQQAVDTLKGIENNTMAEMVRGDAYVALQQYAQAQQAYQATLSQLKTTDPLYPLVQMKLANLPQT